MRTSTFNKQSKVKHDNLGEGTTKVIFCEALVHKYLINTTIRSNRDQQQSTNSVGCIERAKMPRDGSKLLHRFISQSIRQFSLCSDNLIIIKRCNLFLPRGGTFLYWCRCFICGHG